MEAMSEGIALDDDDDDVIAPEAAAVCDEFAGVGLEHAASATTPASSSADAQRERRVFGVRFFKVTQGDTDWGYRRR